MGNQLRGRARLEQALSQPRLAAALEYFPGVHPVRNLEDALDRTGDDALRARFRELVEQARAPKSSAPEVEWPPPPKPEPKNTRKTPEELAEAQRRRSASQRATYARQRQAFFEDVEFMVDTGASREEILHRLNINSWNTLQNRLHKWGRDDLVERIMGPRSSSGTTCTRKARQGKARLAEALESSTLEEALTFYQVKDPRDALRHAVARYPEFRPRYEELLEPALQESRLKQVQEVSKAYRVWADEQRAAFLENVEFLVEQGTSRTELERQFGVTWDAIRVRLKRAGRLDLWARIQPERDNAGRWL